jgi:hypothetical protein
LGIPWGATPQEAQRILKQKDGFRSMTVSAATKEVNRQMYPSGYDCLKFTGPVAEHPAEVTFSFQNNSFYRGLISYYAPESRNVKTNNNNWDLINKLDNELKGQLLAKYG